MVAVFPVLGEPPLFGSPEDALDRRVGLARVGEPRERLSEDSLVVELLSRQRVLVFGD